MRLSGLKPDVGCCECGGRYVFLDVGQDRYVMLPLDLEDLLRRSVTEDHIDDHDMARILATGLFVPSQEEREPGIRLCDVKMDVAASLSVNPGQTKARSPLHCYVLAVLCLVFAHCLLRRLPLRKALALSSGLARGRAMKPLPPRIEAITTAFRQSAWLFPRYRQCLPDAMACQLYLAIQGISARIVFGVQANPFHAHCWVQHQDVVLAQDVELAQTFQPIWTTP